MEESSLIPSRRRGHVQPHFLNVLQVQVQRLEVIALAQPMGKNRFSREIKTQNEVCKR